MPSLSESIRVVDGHDGHDGHDAHDGLSDRAALVASFASAAFCLLPAALCFKAGAPSICPVRRSRVKLQASDAVETRIMLASANQRFEGARICRGSSIAA